MRLDKYISTASGISRKEVKSLIKAGKVIINSFPAKKPEQSVSESDIITIDGKTIVYREFVYLMLNKPAGYVSATEDKHYPTVTDLVPDEFAHFNVFPVGRLDIDTEGLLLLTNDGSLAHELTSPKKHVYKTYFTCLDSPADKEDCLAFERPMNLGDFITLPAHAEITENPCEVLTTVCEGKFHQVKRMWHSLGKDVIYLKRLSMGNLTLDKSLKSGSIRELTSHELELLIKSLDKNINP